MNNEVSSDFVELVKYKPPSVTLSWEDWIKSLSDVKGVIEYWVEDVKIHLDEIESVAEEIEGIKAGANIKVLHKLKAMPGEIRRGVESVKTLLEQLEERYLMDLEYLTDYVSR